ncbi:hypothetical protein DKG77_09235 [Flagellimonas aquimarina]|jgi:hypothetical protein|uniref:Uncharacterized protein n=1 Tax=Flagellimonas aquimarina TaxID=2201895 RepID=A0A316L0F9_9FLAO|nr:hypothetical protein [Allomuricauda koreensis]PWL38439.1 hypothetical protein DKG77_09235 [Allomuricauda koreensis]
MNLKKSLIVALILGAMGLVGWELYWRSQGFSKSIDDNDALWALERSKVDDLSKEDVVLIGSSRVHFDIQLDEWKKITGKKPIQLSSGGCSPLPVFHDIVNTSPFNGTILVGVTPGLFFSTTYPEAPPWAWPQARVDHFHNRTFAQRINHKLSIPLQSSFAFISEVEGIDGINLKELLGKVKIGDRVFDPMPPFHSFEHIRLDRNVRMKKRMETDTAFANTVKKVWQFFMSGGGPPPDKEGTMSFFLEDLKKFKEKGGNVILLRCPSTGYLRDFETNVTPRNKFWDELVEKASVKAYHFEDYPQLQNLTLPEWSHLIADDADYFTREFIKIMQLDGILPNQKTN